ncbi:MAG TPA: BamA/TamA family outer membrane protein, partial [Polyangia bacterium]
NFQLLTFFNTDPVILIDPAQAGRFFGFLDPYRVGWWQQDVALDLRDSAVDPRKGAYALAGAEEGGDYAGGAFTYQKLRGEVRGYVPLGGRLVLAARAQFGHIASQGDLGSPITRRFYLGGPSSHRGFSFGRLSLQVPSGFPGRLPLPVGGDEMFLAQVEVRARLFQVRGSWFAVAAFFDTGDVAAPSCGSGGCPLLPPAAPRHVDFARLHHAVGGGLRFKTVIGTLRADVGVRLNRLAASEPDGLPNPDPGHRIVFHLSVAEAF